MAAPSTTRDSVLVSLRGLQRFLSSAKWVLKIEGENDATREAAGRLALEVSLVKVKLENAVLQDIRDRLIANEAALTSGQAEVEKATKKLDDVTKVLAALTAFVGKVASVLVKP